MTVSRYISTHKLIQNLKYLSSETPGTITGTTAFLHKAVVPAIVPAHLLERTIVPDIVPVVSLEYHALWADIRTSL